VFSEIFLLSGLPTGSFWITNGSESTFELRWK
jgi:hypothetical protein